MLKGLCRLCPEARGLAGSLRMTGRRREADFAAARGRVASHDLKVKVGHEDLERLRAFLVA